MITRIDHDGVTCMQVGLFGLSSLYVAQIRRSGRLTLTERPKPLFYESGAESTLLSCSERGAAAIVQSLGEFYEYRASLRREVGNRGLSPRGSKVCVSVKEYEIQVWLDTDASRQRLRLTQKQPQDREKVEIPLNGLLKCILVMREALDAWDSWGSK